MTKSHANKGNSATEYELYVKMVMEALISAQDLTVTVRHNVRMIGTAGPPGDQFDVYWEHRTAGVVNRIVVECKHYKRMVTKGHVQHLQGVVAGHPGLRGVIATSRGFQSGAVAYAKQHGIGLQIIRPAVEADYAGRVRQFQLNVHVATPKITELRIDADLAWWDANQTPEDQRLTGQMTIGSESLVEDRESGQTRSLGELLHENLPPPGQLEKRELRPKAWFFCTEGKVIKVARLSYNVEVISGPPITAVIGGGIAHAIVKDELSETIVFVEKNGQVTGDIERALGVSDSFSRYLTRALSL